MYKDVSEAINNVHLVLSSGNNTETNRVNMSEINKSISNADTVLGDSGLGKGALAKLFSTAIEISSFDVLRKIGNDSGYPLNGNYELTCDIDASESRRSEFIPIGKKDKPFNGTLEGNGFKISGLFINRERRDNVGLLGNIGKDAEINGVYIVIDTITGQDSVGGLVGVSHGYITNCGVSGTLHGHKDVGGLVGRNLGSISDSYSSVEVSGEENIGGLVGINHGDTVSISGDYALRGTFEGDDYIGSITRCYSTGKVSGKTMVGGFAGSNDGGSIVQCYSTGEVKGGKVNAPSSFMLFQGPSSKVGGFAGNNRYSGSIAQCYSTGEVKGETEIGGFAGNNNHLCNITQCYSTGKANGKTKVGGFAGGGYSPADSFAATSVIGLTMGVVLGKITDCYWDTATSDITESQGGKGKSTAEMHSRATYETWDFDAVWQIDEGKGYPRLRAFAEKS